MSSKSSEVSTPGMARQKRLRTDSTDDSPSQVENNADIMERLSAAVKTLEMEIKSISKVTVAERNKLQECLSEIRDASHNMCLEVVGLKSRLLERSEIVNVLSAQKNVTADKQSYAQALKASISDPASAINAGLTKQRSVKPKWQPSRVVTVKPSAGKESLFANSEEVKSKLRELIKPVVSKIAVKKVSNIRDKGILIETASIEGLDFFIKNKELSEADLVASVPEENLPRIIIYDV